MSESEAWSETERLPVAMRGGLRGVSLNNNIFMIGNFIFIDLLLIIRSNVPGGVGNSNYHNFVFQYSPDNGSWIEVGQLQNGKSYHAASVVNANDIIDYCN